MRVSILWARIYCHDNTYNKESITGTARSSSFHGARLLGNAVSGGTSYSECEFDAVRRWKDGLIVHERFYYQKG